MNGDEKTSLIEGAGYFYSVRVWVENSSLPVDEMSEALEMEPDYSREVDESKASPASMWSSVTWTNGERNFFGEVHDVLLWLQEKRTFLERVKAGGGEFHVIVQLPGRINIGSSMRPETALLAANLGVLIGVEVFPALSDDSKQDGRNSNIP